VGFDGDAPLALQVHRIEHLLLHLAHGERPGQLQQAVGERGFAVIDMRDDRKIADARCFHEDRSILAGAARGAWEGTPALVL